MFSLFKVVNPNVYSGSKTVNNEYMILRDRHLTHYTQNFNVSIDNNDISFVHFVDKHCITMKGTNQIKNNKLSIIFR